MYIAPRHLADGEKPADQSRIPLLDMQGPVLVFGGCYSNLEATEALFRAAAALQIPPSRMICTGDVVAYCADALATTALIRESGVHVIMGNCEESLGNSADDCGCGFEEGSACDRLSAAWYDHADKQLDPGTRAWMNGLPRQLDIRLNGYRLAVVHGAVDQINRFVFASDDAAVFTEQFALSGCDGVLAGHCGLPFTRIVGAKIWHNSGAIGMPANDGTARTWYSVISPSRDGLEIRHHELDYDHETAAAKMRAAALPPGYADALSSGLWPSCDVLPPDELGHRGLPITPEPVVYAHGADDSIMDRRPRRSAEKFVDPVLTASGERRATVPLMALQTLWFNTGTLCNIACQNCYIDSSPKNDRLVYLRREEVQAFMAEAQASHPELCEIGFTGGEPFMNREIAGMLEDALSRGYRCLVLSNAMKPLNRSKADLLALNRRFPGQLSIRVSIDHYTREKHEEIRGPNTWAPAIGGLQWLAGNGFDIAVAGRMLWAEDEQSLRNGYAAMLSSLGIGLPAEDPTRLVLFPEMDNGADVPEITESCWSILHRNPEDLMCSSSRMVVHRKGESVARVSACTLLPYDDRFSLGTTLAEAAQTVSLNHRHCAKFCVLGGASCSV